MSYDLFFEAGKGKTLDKKSFAAWFRARPHYEVRNGQAVYQNEDTGVYFIFDEPEDGAVAMNLNLFRPHTFGLEAALEIEPFAKAFGAAVIDPQSGAETFDREAFLRSYDDANKFAYKSIVPEQRPVYTWPTRRMRDVWKWNYTRPSDEEQEKAGFFWPGIFPIEVHGEACSLAIWPPQCAIILPEVDFVLVPLAQEGKLADERALVPWSEILPVAKRYKEKSDGIARYRLDNEPEQFSAEVMAFLTVKRKQVGKLKGIAFEEILDREVVDAVA